VFGRRSDKEDDDPPPVSRFFPVVTASRRDSIEQRQRINDSRRAAERMWAEILGRLQAEQRRMRWAK
jgi:hypothetical protein